MKFEHLLDLVGGLPWFELAMVVQLSGEKRSGIINQLHRFAQAGKIVPLRRGMYVLGERYRKVAPLPAELASAMYHPSYLSTEWALSFYGVIAESAHQMTSVTTRSPKRFVNAFGDYLYRHVKPEMFFGSEPVVLNGRRVLIATPEKALVDFWYLERGEWTDARMDQLRLTGGALDQGELEGIINRVGTPRLERAFEAWSRVAEDTAQGEVEL